MQEFVEKIKSLSQEKEAFTQSLEIENENLREQVSQLTAQNEAYMQENASIAELCLAEGIRDDSGGIPEQPVQFLIKERVRFMEKAGEDQGKTKQLAQELERMKQEVTRMREIEKQKILLEAKVVSNRMMASEHYIELGIIYSTEAACVTGNMKYPESFQADRIHDYYGSASNLCNYRVAQTCPTMHARAARGFGCWSPSSRFFFRKLHYPKFLSWRSSTHSKGIEGLSHHTSNPVSYIM